MIPWRHSFQKFAKSVAGSHLDIIDSHFVLRVRSKAVLSAVIQNIIKSNFLFC